MTSDKKAKAKPMEQDQVKPSRQRQISEDQTPTVEVYTQEASIDAKDGHFDFSKVTEEEVEFEKGSSPVRKLRTPAKEKEVSTERKSIVPITV